MRLPTLPDFKRTRKWPRNGWRFLEDNWWPLLSSALVIIIVGTLFGAKLMGLTGHQLSASEQVLENHLLHRDFGLRAVLQNPVNLPYVLGVYILEKLRITNPLALRSISAGFGVLAIGSFYLILKNWHTQRVAILGTTLFATSAWMLHTSRLASPDILFCMPMLLILCATWLEVSPKRRVTLTLCLITALLLLYIPGMIIFVAAGITWQAKHIYQELRQTSWWFLVPWIGLGLLLLLPLGWMLVTAPHNILALLGIPSRLPSPKQYGLNLLLVPVHIFARGPGEPTLWLGRLPLLDIFASLMVAIGIYAYAFRFRLDRTKLLTGVAIVGSLLIALGGAVSLTLLVPVVYILACGGITLMLQQWSTVFPRNPFARTLATTMMSIVVLLASFYNINHYFIAWPNAPETRAAFHESSRL